MLGRLFLQLYPPLRVIARNEAISTLVNQCPKMIVPTTAKRNLSIDCRLQRLFVSRKDGFEENHFLTVFLFTII